MEKHQEEVLNKGIILLTGEIGEANVKEVIEKILYLNHKDGIKTIELIVNSIGGSVTNSFSLIDIMRTSKKPVNTIGIGYICSAGLSIFISGVERRISANASILAHQYAWGNTGQKYHELIGRRVEEELTNERILALYKRQTKKSVKFIKEKLLRETDTWLSAKEAVSYGLADKIIKSF